MKIITKRSFLEKFPNIIHSNVTEKKSAVKERFKVYFRSSEDGIRQIGL